MATVAAAAVAPPMRNLRRVFAAALVPLEVVFSLMAPSSFVLDIVARLLTPAPRPARISPDSCPVRNAFRLGIAQVSRMRKADLPTAGLQKRKGAAEAAPGLNPPVSRSGRLFLLDDL